MSIDLVVLVTCSVALPTALPEAAAWKNYGNKDWAYEERLWQVVIEPITVPKGSVASNGYAVVVEPSRAPEKAFLFQKHVTESLAKQCGGAIVFGPGGKYTLDGEGNEES